MVTVFDMGSWEVIFQSQSAGPAPAGTLHPLKSHAQLGLQPVRSEPHTQGSLPPELALTSPETFVNRWKMPRA